MGIIFIAIIVILVLIVLGLGISGTFEAVQKGWQKIPAENVTKHFQEAAEKSAIDISKEIEP